MDLSLIICTWNNQDRLRITLGMLSHCDILANLSWECIIVNNNSTDDSEKAILSFQNKLPIKYVFEPQQGLSAARNSGLKEAVGKLIIWADDDIEPCKDWLKIYWEAYQRFPSGYFFGGPIKSNFEKGELDPNLIEIAPNSVKGFNLGNKEIFLNKDQCFLGANWACPSEIIKILGGFDIEKGLNPVSKTLRVGEETDLMKRLVEAGLQGLYLPEAKIKHFVPSKKMTLEHIAARWEAWGFEESDQYKIYLENIPLGRLPRWMIKESIFKWLNYIYLRISGQKWHRAYIVFREYLGILKGLKSTTVRIDKIVVVPLINQHGFPINDNKKAVTVSVIIPTYNKTLYIQQAIDSVLSRTYKDLQIIVVDDGSTDDTLSKLKSYIHSNQITYIYQTNQGPSVARNAGLRVANGKYIKFLDSDDFLYPEQIEKQIQDIKNEPEAISITDSLVLKLNGNTEERRVYLVSREKQLASFIESNRGVIHAFLVPKSLLESVGGFNESLNCSEDTDLWIRTLENGAYMKHLPIIGCCYRMLKTGISNNTENMFFQKIKIYERVNESFLTKKLSSFFLIESLLGINTRLLEECEARELNPLERMPFTLKMTDRLYDLNIKGVSRLIYKSTGIQHYLKVRFLFKSLIKKNYRSNLLQHNYSWRY